MMGSRARLITRHVEEKCCIVTGGKKNNWLPRTPHPDVPYFTAVQASISLTLSPIG